MVHVSFEELALSIAIGRPVVARVYARPAQAADVLVLSRRGAHTAARAAVVGIVRRVSAVASTGHLACSAAVVISAGTGEPGGLLVARTAGLETLVLLPAVATFAKGFAWVLSTWI